MRSLVVAPVDDAGVVSEIILKLVQTLGHLFELSLFLFGERRVFIILCDETGGTARTGVDETALELSKLLFQSHGLGGEEGFDPFDVFFDVFFDHLGVVDEAQLSMPPMPVRLLRNFFDEI